MRAFQRAPLVVVLVTLIIAGAGALTLGMSLKESSHTAPASCTETDLAVSHPYPVSGYWVYPRSDPCEWRKTLQRIHKLGGDTLIQFGPTLEARRIGPNGKVLNHAGKVDPEFEDCVESGKTCFQAAQDALRGANPTNTIVQTYVYSSTEPFGPALVRCPPFDRRIVVGSHVYYRLLLPAERPSDRSCDFSRGGTFRLVLVAGSTRDSVGALLSEADRFHMQVFLGMPAAPKNRAKPWMPALEHTDTLVAFTRRVLEVYAGRYDDHRSFRGFYQTFEVQLRRQPNAATLQIYDAQHGVVQAVFPTKDILVSPYWDARRRVNSGTPPAEVKTGFIRVAKTGVDIIAPQDGLGTGKTAMYWQHQAAEKVSSRLQPVFGVGATEYGEAYYAPVRAYYRAVAKARDHLARKNVPVELWATVEAFEPTADKQCAPFTDRGRTHKARLDRALTMIGPYPTRIISFMWDGLFTCHGNSTKPLATQVAGDWNRPIMVDAFRASGGLVIRGYNLGGGTVILRYHSGVIRTQSIVVERDGRYRPNVGRRSSKLPEMLEEVWVPLQSGRTQPGKLYIVVRNSSGKQAVQPYHL